MGELQQAGGATATWRDYKELTKPNVVLLMILTSAVGMLMAVPLLVSLRVFCRHIPRLSALEAFLLSRLGRYQEAAARLHELYRKDRTDIEVLLSLAWATVNTGDVDEARRWVDRAWELVADDAASDRAVRVSLSAAGSLRSAR